jgi:hypothetical protein
MAVTTTSRLGISRWSDDGDPFTRGQMDLSHAALEDLAAKFIASNTQPSSTASNARTLWLNTTNNTLSYYSSESDGGQWLSVNSPGSAGQMTTHSFTINQNSAGVLTQYARIDHTHALPLAEIQSFLTDYIAKSAVSAKGDLLVAAASQSVTRLGVGSNNQILIADSAATNGLRWGSVVAASIQDGSVTNGKLAAGAVTDDKVTSVTAAKVSDAYGKGTAVPAGRRITISATQPSGSANGDIWIKP